MKTKEEIVQNWLPRYTGENLESFGKYILLTNFSHYVTLFAQWNQVEVKGIGKPMQCATANDISIINFGMGSPGRYNHGFIDSCRTQGRTFLGKCGGLKKRNKLGDLILPIAAIRGEGTSNDYFPTEVPALPAFALQKQFLLPYVTMRWTIGRALFIPPTDAFGNTMRNSKTIYRKSEPTPLIWRPPPFLP